MANTYTITSSDGTFDFLVDESTEVQQYGLTFTGRGVTNYGASRNQNLLLLLDNFASANTSEPVPLLGRLWYDTTDDTLKLCDDGANFNTFGDDIYLLGVTRGISGNTVLLPRANASDINLSPTANIAQQNELLDHFNGTESHRADAISLPAGLGIPTNPTNVQAALAQIDLVLDNHLALVNSRHTASAIRVNPAVLSENNVQDALEALNSRRQTLQASAGGGSSAVTAHINDPTDAHDATAISFDNTGVVPPMASTDVQDAIEEINTNIGALPTAVGYVDVARAYAVSSTSITPTPSTWTPLNTSTVLFGDDFNNFSGGVYTADRNMLVRIRGYATFEFGATNPFASQEAGLRITVNGNMVRRGSEPRKGSTSVLPVRIYVECSVVAELAASDQVRLEATTLKTSGVEPEGSTVLGGFSNNSLEIEVLAEL
jgi:hypothetical protein